MQSIAQDKVIPNRYKFKGKLEKNNSYEKDCSCQNTKEIAVVLEFTITNPEDILAFGEKIYVAEICYELEFNENHYNKEYYIEIRDTQMWKWEISIINSNLFEKNKDKKIYWLESISIPGHKLNSCRR